MYNIFKNINKTKKQNKNNKKEQKEKNRILKESNLFSMFHQIFSSSLTALIQWTPLIKNTLGPGCFVFSNLNKRHRVTVHTITTEC